MLESANNNGYDDDQGSYVHVPHDHVAYRYEVLRMLGKGSFGQVVKVYDHREHISVALKMVLLLLLLLSVFNHPSCAELQDSRLHWISTGNLRDLCSTFFYKPDTFHVSQPQMTKH